MKKHGSFKLKTDWLELLQLQINILLQFYCRTYFVQQLWTNLLFQKFHYYVV